MAETIELELQADENGEVHITKEQLGDAQPGVRYRVRLEPQAVQPSWGPRWANLTPEERAKDFLVWVERFRDKDAPGLSDWAVSRDSIYD